MTANFNPQVLYTVQQAVALIPMIAEDRKNSLEKLSRYVAGNVKAGQAVPIITICTHNSRRSHLGQVWSQVIAEYFGIPGVVAYSGGTEATACHPNTIQALKNQGFEIAVNTTGPGTEGNPLYQITYAADKNPVQCWSKKFNDPANPQKDFAAIMVCGSADGACPIVPGCALRLAHTFIDPKASDNSPEQNATYQARSLQIAAEIAFAMQKAAELIKG